MRYGDAPLSATAIPAFVRVREALAAGDPLTGPAIARATALLLLLVGRATPQP